VQKNIELSNVTWMRKATGRAAGVSISLSGEIMRIAHLQGITEVELVMVEGGGLFIRRPLPAPIPGVPSESAFKEEPAKDGGLF
jgi:hypothetical protein